jgi:hypothetical protein
MRYWDNVHTEEREGFTLTLSFTSEDSKPDWEMTEEEQRDLFEKINNGTLLWFIARVEASKNGVILGTDYLGGCCYESVKDFIEVGYYADMVHEAIAEARKTLDGLVGSLVPA